MAAREIAVRCRILPGGFSGERIFVVTKADGVEYKGMAPRDYCWKDEGTPLQPDEPAIGRSLDGLVAARLLGNQTNEIAVVTTPDGEVFPVEKENIHPRPENIAHVPIG